MKKQLIILSSSYPLDNKETFLITELPFLSLKFEEILFIPMDLEIGQIDYHKHTNLFKTNKNCFKIIKWDVLRMFFSSIFWREFLRIYFTFTRKHKFRCLKTAMVSLIRGSKCAKELKKGAQENAVCYSYWGVNGAVCLAILKKQGFQSKLISRFHGWDVFEEVSQIKYLPFRKMIFNNLDLLVPISVAAENYIRLKYNPKSAIKTYHLGSNEPKGKKYNEKESVDLILTLSNFNEVKRIPLIVESLSFLKGKINWIHIGGGDKKPEVEKLANKLLPSNLNFQFLGELSHDEVLNFLSKTDISFLLNLSSSEGVPVSMMEAMSYGIPVFATNVGGVSEIVDSSCGYLVHKDLPAKEIAEKMEEFLVKSKLIETKIAAKNKWSEKFQAAHNFTQFASKLSSFVD